MSILNLIWIIPVIFTIGFLTGFTICCLMTLSSDQSREEERNHNNDITQY